MISNPTPKGKTSEAIILAVLARLGKSILIPWGEERYDLEIDGRYAGQIDAFPVYGPQTGRVYMVPIEAIPPPFHGYLRVEPTLNGQIANIRWARDYEIGSFITELAEGKSG